MKSLEQFEPYFIVGTIVVLIIVLLFIRKHLARRAYLPRIRVGNGQTIGKRQEQDDYFATVHHLNATLAVLADGISGMRNGRLASTVAVTAFTEHFQKLLTLEHLQAFFLQTARAGNSEILRRLNGAKGGTTLIAAVITDGQLYWGSVGDSVLMVYRNGEFIKLNRMHTFGEVLTQRYLSGEVSKEEVATNPMRNRLVNYLGHEGFKDIEVCETPFSLEKKDLVILCSDGVYHALTELEMEQLLKQHHNPHKAAEAFIAAVEEKDRENQDNATIILLDKGW